MGNLGCFHETGSDLFSIQDLKSIQCNHIKETSELDMLNSVKWKMACDYEL